MQVHSFELRGVTVVSLAEVRTVGALNAAEFRSRLSSVLEDRTHVVLDTSEIEFFDNDGLDALLSLSDEIRGRNGVLALAGVAQDLREFFGIVGVDWAFPIFANVPDAVLGLVKRESGAEVWH